MGEIHKTNFHLRLWYLQWDNLGKQFFYNLWIFEACNRGWTNLLFKETKGKIVDNKLCQSFITKKKLGFIT